MSGINCVKSNKCEMCFSIYLPNTSKKLPVLYFLSGLTCTEQNFIQKSGMQKYASKEKIIITINKLINKFFFKYSGI